MLTIDETRGEVVVQGADGSRRTLAFDTPEAFEALSAAWLRCGRDVMHVHNFTWLGRPLIQLPEDLLRMQEFLWRTQPDVLVQTGVAHGGSLVFYASVLAALGHGRVVGVDLDIAANDRAAIEAHPMAPHIALIEGSSICPRTLAAVRTHIACAEQVVIVLDSDHAERRLDAELEAYAPLVPPGGQMVVRDGILANVAGGPHMDTVRACDGPGGAIDAFLAAHPEFAHEKPGWLSDQRSSRGRMTYWPRCFLRRVA